MASWAALPDDCVSRLCEVATAPTLPVLSRLQKRSRRGAAARLAALAALRSVPFGLTGAAILGIARLRSQCDGVHSLDYSSAPLSPDETRDLFAALGSGALPRLKHMRLNGSRVDEPSMQAIARALGNDALPVLGLLEELQLSRCQITDDAMSVFAGAVLGSRLGALHRLQRLDLNNNHISDTGLIAFSAAITGAGVLMSLRIVSLMANPFGDAGLDALATALTHKTALPSLQALYLLLLLFERPDLARSLFGSWESSQERHLSRAVTFTSDDALMRMRSVCASRGVALSF